MKRVERSKLELEEEIRKTPSGGKKNVLRAELGERESLEEVEKWKGVVGWDRFSVVKGRGLIVIRRLEDAL